MQKFNLLFRYFCKQVTTGKQQFLTLLMMFLRRLQGTRSFYCKLLTKTLRLTTYIYLRRTLYSICLKCKYHQSIQANKLQLNTMNKSKTIVFLSSLRSQWAKCSLPDNLLLWSTERWLEE